MCRQCPEYRRQVGQPLPCSGPVSDQGTPQASGDTPSTSTSITTGETAVPSVLWLCYEDAAGISAGSSLLSCSLPLLVLPRLIACCFSYLFLICSFCMCPDTHTDLNILSILQPRIMCVPCKEATPYAPAASSPCPTGGRSVSRTPASPPSSVS